MNAVQGYTSFQNDRDVEVNFGYPVTGVGKFTVTCVIVRVSQVKHNDCHCKKRLEFQFCYF